jgi:hypothetical protein
MLSILALIKNERGFIKKGEIKNPPAHKRKILIIFLFINLTVTTPYRANDPYFC